MDIIIQSATYSSHTGYPEESAADASLGERLASIRHRPIKISNSLGKFRALLRHVARLFFTALLHSTQPTVQRKLYQWLTTFPSCSTHLGVDSSGRGARAD